MSRQSRHGRRRAGRRERRRRTRAATRLVCRWSAAGLHQDQARPGRFETVAGRECRLLVYPKGDSMALPGYISASGRWLSKGGDERENGTSPTTGADAPLPLPPEEFTPRSPRGARARRGLVPTRASVMAHRRPGEPALGVGRAGFSSRHRRRVHGWCAFARSAVVLEGTEPRQPGGRHADGGGAIMARRRVPRGEPGARRRRRPRGRASSRGRWRTCGTSPVMLKTQKVMSPSFVVGGLSSIAYQSAVKRRRRWGRRRPRRIRPAPGPGARESAAGPGEQGDCHDQRRQSRGARRRGRGGRRAPASGWSARVSKVPGGSAVRRPWRRTAAGRRRASPEGTHGGDQADGKKSCPSGLVRTLRRRRGRRGHDRGLGGTISAAHGDVRGAT